MQSSQRQQTCHREPANNQACRGGGKRYARGDEESDFGQDAAETQGAAELGCDEQYGDGLASKIRLSGIQHEFLGASVCGREPVARAGPCHQAHAYSQVVSVRGLAVYRALLFKEADGGVYFCFGCVWQSVWRQEVDEPASGINCRIGDRVAWLVCPQPVHQVLCVVYHPVVV